MAENLMLWTTWGGEQNSQGSSILGTFAGSAPAWECYVLEAQSFRMAAALLWDGSCMHTSPRQRHHHGRMLWRMDEGAVRRGVLRREAMPRSPGTGGCQAPRGEMPQGFLWARRGLEEECGTRQDLGWLRGKGEGLRMTFGWAWWRCQQCWVIWRKRLGVRVP